MSIGRMLIHRCDIFRHGDKMSGNFTKKELAPIYENKRCRFIRKSSTNTETMGHVKVSTYYVLMLPKSVRVKNGDVIYWTPEPDESDSQDDSKTILKFKVEEPYAPSGRYRRVSIEREDEV